MALGRAFGWASSDLLVLVCRNQHQHQTNTSKHDVLQCGTSGGWIVGEQQVAGLQQIAVGQGSGFQGWGLQRAAVVRSRWMWVGCSSWRRRQSVSVGLGAEGTHAVPCPAGKTCGRVKPTYVESSQVKSNQGGSGRQRVAAMRGRDRRGLGDPPTAGDFELRDSMTGSSKCTTTRACMHSRMHARAHS